MSLRVKEKESQLYALISLIVWMFSRLNINPGTEFEKAKAKRALHLTMVLKTVKDDNYQSAQ